MTSRLFGVGIAGPSISRREREILQRLPPFGVILFRRNIQSAEGLRELVSEIRRLPSLVCLDQEGGPVDRTRDLLGPTISFREAAERGVARRAGELAGDACAAFGVSIDLAPVVDRLLPGASAEILRDRAASADPNEIARAARSFLDGLHARGVGGCVKHFPGLGRARLDTHEALPLISWDPVEEERDLAPFRKTMRKAGAVMISHAAGPEGRPASLWREKAHGLLRERLGFDGAAFSDDLEMGALAAFGSLPERCAAACRAGCDLLLVCSRLGDYPECVGAVERGVAAARRGEAAGRLRRYERNLGRIRRAAPAASERPLEALVADIRALREGPLVSS